MGRKKEVRELGRRYAYDYGTCRLGLDDTQMDEYLEFMESNEDYPWLTRMIGPKVPGPQRKARLRVIEPLVHDAYLVAVDCIKRALGLDDYYGDQADLGVVADYAAGVK
jgi:hypothetical protein